MILPGTPVQVFTAAENGTGAISVTAAPAGPPTDWVGASPWLTTDDQLTSYAYGVGGTGFPAKVGWLCDSVAGLSGDLVVSTSSTYAAGSSTSVSLWVHDVAILTTPGADLVDDALAVGSTFSPFGLWDVTTASFPVTPEMTTAAAAGRLVVVALIGDLMRLSLLLVEGDAGRPFTRIMQRGDALGMGSGRVYATGTRQSSTRVFGTH